jgi:small subunit ribosomal protein S18
MARGNMRNTSTRRTSKDAGRRVKKKPCALCRDHIEWVDYKDVSMLRKYMSDRGKIRSRRVTGNCAQHQRGIALAIKTARELVLLPYTQRTVTERPGGRRGGRDGREGRDGRGPGDRRGPRAEAEADEPSAATDATDATDVGSDGAEAATSAPQAPAPAEPEVGPAASGDGPPDSAEES